MSLWKIKAIFWRWYYWTFTDKFSEFDSLREVLDVPYQKYAPTHAKQTWKRKCK